MGRTWRQSGTLLGHNHFVSALSLDEDLRLVIASWDLLFSFFVSDLSLFQWAIKPIIFSTEPFFPLVR